MQYDAADLEWAECRVRQDVWSCAPLDAVMEAGIEARWFGPVLATTCAALPDAPGMNLVQGAAEPSAVEHGRLEEAFAWMQSWEVDFLVPVAAGRPGSARAEQWLHWHGCEQSAVVRKYLRPVSPPPRRETPGVEVRALPPEPSEALGCLIGGGLDLPGLAEVLFIDLPCRAGWRCYVASVEGEEAACGSMRIERGIAFLGIDAVLAHARGRGCGRALLQRQLQDAAAAGCHTAIAARVDDPAHPHAAAHDLQHAGFVEAYRSVAWRPPVGVAVC